MVIPSAAQSNPGEFLGRKVPTIQILDVGAMATGRSGTMRWWPRDWRKSPASSPIRRNTLACRAGKAPIGIFPTSSVRPAGHVSPDPLSGMFFTADARSQGHRLFMTIGCADPGGNFHVQKTKPSKPSGSTISNRRLRSISSKSMPRDTSWISCATGRPRFQTRWSSNARWSSSRCIGSSRCSATSNASCVTSASCCTS